MQKKSDVLALTQELIEIASITPNDEDCQAILKDLLTKLGFKITAIPHGDADNFWAIRGDQGPCFVFAGHTDVVQPGPLDKWETKPFKPTIKGDFLYGRGAADMKGSLAAMLVACEDFITANPNHSGQIAFLITSAEEGPSELGTPIVLEYLAEQKQTIDYCLVGEPTSHTQLGDMLKNGRRGSLTGKLCIHGQQGHIAYPHLAENPIHIALKALEELTSTQWDQGNEFFQATSFQVSNIHAGEGAGNVIPGHLYVLFNLRYSPEVSAAELKNKINSILEQHDLRFDIEWTHYGKPYLTEGGKLLDAACNAINMLCDVKPEISTSGGTSDGRYIAEYCNEVIEFGPSNATIHKVNENVKISDLELLAQVYTQILTDVLG